MAEETKDLSTPVDFPKEIRELGPNESVVVPLDDYDFQKCVDLNEQFKALDAQANQIVANMQSQLAQLNAEAEALRRAHWRTLSAKYGIDITEPHLLFAAPVFTPDNEDLPLIVRVLTPDHPDYKAPANPENTTGPVEVPQV